MSISNRSTNLPTGRRRSVITCLFSHIKITYVVGTPFNFPRNNFLSPTGTILFVVRLQNEMDIQHHRGRLSVAITSGSISRSSEHYDGNDNNESDNAFSLKRIRWWGNRILEETWAYRVINQSWFPSTNCNKSIAEVIRNRILSGYLKIATRPAGIFFPTDRTNTQSNMFDHFFSVCRLE